jgi:hypothetical protein
MKNTLLLFILLSNLCFAQSYEKAKNLLDRVSGQMKSKENIRFGFSYVLENKKEQIRQEMEGNVTLSGDRYILNFLEAEQLFDGEKIYTIVPENEEITISTPEEDDDVSVNPSKLLIFYEKGYGYEWDIQQRVMGKKIQFIKLLPIDDTTEINYLLLGIDTERLEVYRLIQVGSNGTMTIVLPSDYFVFDQKKFPNYYINE